jgi:hypothetical protein
MDERTIARFWAKVDKSAGPDGCWMWTARLVPTGYGGFRYAGGQLAHRAAWEITHGRVPHSDGYHGTCVCHRCDVRACVNPAHLFLGTHADNMADKKSKGRASRSGPIVSVKGERVNTAKLTATDVVSLRAAVAGGCPVAKAARDFGISVHNAYSIVCGKTWRHLL